MHCCLLGVMRKLLNLWICRSPSRYKLSNRQIAEIDSRMYDIAKSIPSMFSRKPRSLKEVDRWKATEFRLFLLYIGKIVLKKILEKKYYKHFLIFNHAIALLVSNDHSSNIVKINFSKRLLVYFVEKGITLYGDSFPVYNVHALLHLPEDAILNGSLENCSAFRFENYLHILKNKVKSTKMPIVELVNKIYQDLTLKNDIKIKKYKLKYPNNCFFYTNKVYEVIENDNCINVDYTIFSRCRVYNKLYPLNSYTFESDNINLNDIGCFKFYGVDSKIELIRTSELNNQCIFIKNNTNLIILSILHM